MSEAVVNYKPPEGELVFAKGFLRAVNEALDDIKHRYFFIGFRLDEANSLRFYESLGYTSIAELAEAEFGFKRATTYGLMQVYNYAKDHGMYMSKKFDKYGYTQLLEMSKAKTVTDSRLVASGIERILTPAVTVARIKEIRSKWDKYISEHGKLPKCDTVEEFEEELNEEIDEAADEGTRPQNSGEAGAMRPKEEIIRIGLTGVDIYVKDAKFKIYDKYLNEPSTSKLAEYIKGVYNYDNKPNFYHGFAAADMHRCYSEKGIEFICFNPYQRLELGWDEVARKVSGLIYTGEYLTDAEMEAYTQWKAEQDGLIVNVAEPKAVEEPAKPGKLNLKNDKARREWLDNFRSWGVWLEIPQVDKTFYRYDFANGCSLIVEVGYEYWDAWSTKKGAHERVSYSIIDNDHPKFNSKGESYTDTVKWLTNHAKEI